MLQRNVHIKLSFWLRAVFTVVGRVTCSDVDRKKVTAAKTISLYTRSLDHCYLEALENISVWE